MKERQKEQTKKAGTIILHHNDLTQVALIYRVKEKDWTFPKGHVEEGEMPSSTCIREAKEETGLEIEILAQLPNSEYCHESGSIITTFMYLARSKGGDFIVEHPGDKIEWVDIYEVENRLTYDNLKKYYRDILPIIENRVLSNYSPWEVFAKK